MTRTSFLLLFVGNCYGFDKRDRYFVIGSLVTQIKQSTPTTLIRSLLNIVAS